VLFGAIALSFLFSSGVCLVTRRVPISNREGASIFSSFSQSSASACTATKSSGSEDDDDSKNNQIVELDTGYRFGDISRFLAKRAAGRINELTGKEKYEFGDLTKWIDRRAKEKVADFTGKEEYCFGDVSNEIARRIAEGEIEPRDAFLALRVLLSAGASLTPLASALPVQWLLDLVNFGLAQDIGGRLLEILARNLDERMKEALTGDSQYKLGDLTKRRIRQSISDVTARDAYDFGDISRRISALAAKKKQSGFDDETRKQDYELQLNDDVVKDLKAWDRRYQYEHHPSQSNL